jgi:hypothetical protein
MPGFEILVFLLQRQQRARKRQLSHLFQRGPVAMLCWCHSELAECCYLLSIAAPRWCLYKIIVR